MIILIVTVSISYKPIAFTNVISKNVIKSDACIKDESVFYHNNLFVHGSRVRKSCGQQNPLLCSIITCGRFHLPVKIRSSKQFPE